MKPKNKITLTPLLLPLLLLVALINNYEVKAQPYTETITAEGTYYFPH